MEQEKIYVEKEHKDYASKGVAGTALGLGIAGTALWLLNNGGLGSGLFGGGSNGNTYQQTEIDALRSKECQDALELTRSIYNGRIVAMQERFDDRQTINQEMFGLYKSQVNGDFDLYKSQRDGFDILANRISNLEKDVAVGAAIRPYQDKLIQCEIDKAYTSSINYTNQKTCRMISGEVVLPNSPLVTGFGSYNPCRPCPAPKA